MSTPVASVAAGGGECCGWGVGPITDRAKVSDWRSGWGLGASDRPVVKQSCIWGLVVISRTFFTEVEASNCRIKKHRAHLEQKKCLLLPSLIRSLLFAEQSMSVYNMHGLTGWGISVWANDLSRVCLMCIRLDIVWIGQDPKANLGRDTPSPSAWVAWHCAVKKPCPLVSLSAYASPCPTAATFGSKVPWPIANQMQSIIGRGLPLLLTMNKSLLIAHPISLGSAFKFLILNLSPNILTVGTSGLDHL